MTSDEVSKDPDGPLQGDGPPTANVDAVPSGDGPPTANVDANVDAVPSGDGPPTANVDDEDPGWPWSFILLVVAGAIYLIFRFAEVIIKLLN